MLQQQKKYNASLEAFNRTLSLDPKNETALAGLAVIYEELKMFAKCDSIYEVALQRLPDNPLILNNYSYSLTERNKDLSRALKMAQRAVELSPDNSAYLDTYGWVQYKLGNYQEAEKYIKKAVELRSNSAVVLEHLGDVYRALGKVDRALEYWQKALQLDKENEKLKRKIEEHRQ